MAFSFENNAIPLAEMKVKVINSLELVNMVDFINHSPYELSGGQKQRVSLAGVLGSDAEILLFDEPLANLDPASGSEIMQLINDIHEKTNKTIIIVEHRIEDVLEQPFDKVVIIDKGVVKGVGTPNEILKSDLLTNSGLREPLYVEAMKLAGCDVSSEDNLRDINSINEENKSNERVENIENHIPYIDKNNDEIDNSIINERYENVKKEDLTYDTEEDDSKDNEKEVITQVYFADSTKNDINYKKILQGFSYASESNPCDLTYNQAIELVKKLLPDDIKQVNSTVDEEVDKEYIYYESSKGNFRVGLSYGY